MLLSAVSVLVVAQSSSEIPEGLMNNPVLFSVCYVFYDGEPGGRALLLGTPKDMVNKAPEMGVCFHRGPLLGNMEGRSFPRTFERRNKFLYLGEFL